MRSGPPLQAKLILTFLLLLTTFWIPNFLRADGGSWTRIDYEYRGFLVTLPSHSSWHYNATRGSGDLWTINLTISGTGFSPTTIIICNDSAYQSWLINQTTTNCLLSNQVDWNLNTQAAFPHTSTWHLILNNTGSVALLFSLTITLYQWTSTTTNDPPNIDLFDRFDDALGWFISLLIIVFVVIPCACSCIRKKRGGGVQEIIEEVGDA